MPAVFKQIFDYKSKTQRIDFLIGCFTLAITKVGSAVLLVALKINMDTAKGIMYIINSFLIVAFLTLMVRRLADAGYSRAGMWVLLVPVIGPFWLLFRLLCPQNYADYQNAEDRYKEYAADPVAFRKKYFQNNHTD